MLHVREKYVKNFLRAKKGAQHCWETAILTWILAASEYDFPKNDKNCFLLPKNNFYMSCDALSYTKSFLGL